MNKKNKKESEYMNIAALGVYQKKNNRKRILFFFLCFVHESVNGFQVFG